MPWVTLRQLVRIKRHGTLTTYHPGDSVNVGKQTAREWLLSGVAKDPFGQVAEQVYSDGEYGIVIRGEEGSVSPAALEGLVGTVPVTYGEPCVPYKYTFIWNPYVTASRKFVEYGWHRISDDWEMAAALVSVDIQADSVGTKYDKEATEKLLGSLRLAVYNTGHIWARKCEESERVVDEFARILADGQVGEEHAFLQALYKKRCKLFTMPVDWM